MPAHVAQIDLPYTPQQVFDLVADIESYPRFLPHVASVHIRSRNGNILVVDQRLRFKFIDLPFTTRAVLEPPARISIVCADAPFGTFTEQWSFAAKPSGGTTLRSTTEFTLRSGLLRALLSAAFGELQVATLRAFRARARELYE
jgi:coenzyme Q-binding protein COQ10